MRKGGVLMVRLTGNVRTDDCKWKISSKMGGALYGW